MEDRNFYLTHLQSMIFKLLPMKEDFDNGADNHLFDYIENLEVNCKGATERFPELKESTIFCDVINDLFYLQTSDVSFGKWRNVVLRDTRKIHSLISSEGQVNDGGR